MDEWVDGRMATLREGLDLCTDCWETGRLGDWKTGRLGDWKTGRLGDWKTGRLALSHVCQDVCVPPHHHHTTTTPPPRHHHTTTPPHHHTTPPPHPHGLTWMEESVDPSPGMPTPVVAQSAENIESE